MEIEEQEDEQEIELPEQEEQETEESEQQMIYKLIIEKWNKIQKVTAEFDIELSDNDRNRIVQLISQRLNTMNTMPPSYSVHFMNSNSNSYLDEDGFSNMDMDEAIRQSLES